MKSRKITETQGLSTEFSSLIYLFTGVPHQRNDVLVAYTNNVSVVNLVTNR